MHQIYRDLKARFMAACQVCCSSPDPYPFRGASLSCLAFGGRFPSRTYLAAPIPTRRPCTTYVARCVTLHNPLLSFALKFVQITPSLLQRVTPSRRRIASRRSWCRCSWSSIIRSRSSRWTPCTPPLRLGRVETSRTCGERSNRRLLFLSRAFSIVLCVAVCVVVCVNSKRWNRI